MSALILKGRFGDETGAATLGNRITEILPQINISNPPSVFQYFCNKHDRRMYWFFTFANGVLNYGLKPTWVNCIWLLPVYTFKFLVPWFLSLRKSGWLTMQIHRKNGTYFEKTVCTNYIIYRITSKIFSKSFYQGSLSTPGSIFYEGKFNWVKIGCQS